MIFNVSLLVIGKKMPLR